MNQHTPIPHKKYREILAVMPIYTVDVLFLNKEKTKILLFKRENEPLRGAYYSIGGRLLKNEKIVDGAMRQAQREVRVKIPKSKLIFGGVQEEIHHNSAFDNTSYHAVAFFYNCIVDEKKFKPHLDNQHSDYKWFSLEDNKIHPLMKKRIRKIKKRVWDSL